MTLTPIKNLVLIRMDNRKTSSEGGIAIPEISQKTETWGEVHATGKACEMVTTGDSVYVPSHLGTVVIVDGLDYILIEETKLLAKR